MVIELQQSSSKWNSCSGQDKGEGSMNLVTQSEYVNLPVLSLVVSLWKSVGIHYANACPH